MKIQLASSPRPHLRNPYFPASPLVETPREKLLKSGSGVIINFQQIPSLLGNMFRRLSKSKKAHPRSKQSTHSQIPLLSTELNQSETTLVSSQKTAPQATRSQRKTKRSKIQRILVGAFMFMAQSPNQFLLSTLSTS